MAYSGKFRPKNPKKYAGDPQNSVWRSSWELRLMKELDENPSILHWASEELTVPYWDPVKKKNRRYYPDFLIRKKDVKTGKEETVMIEVKPSSQSSLPVLKEGKKPTKSYYKSLYTWGTNEAKWKAAKSFCEEKGWTFLVLTEKDLGIRF